MRYPTCSTATKQCHADKLLMPLRARPVAHGMRCQFCTVVHPYVCWSAVGVHELVEHADEGVSVDATRDADCERLAAELIGNVQQF